MVPQCHAAPGQYLRVIIDLRSVRAVVLPGTGSDDDYIGRAFGEPLRDGDADPGIVDELAVLLAPVIGQGDAAPGIA